MSKVGKSFEQNPNPTKRGVLKTRVSNWTGKHDLSNSQSQNQLKDPSPKQAQNPYHDYRLHLRDPQSLANRRQEDPLDTSLTDGLQPTLTYTQSINENMPTNNRGNIAPSHQKKRSYTDGNAEIDRSKYLESLSNFDPYPIAKETSFMRLSNGHDDIGGSSPQSFRFLQFSNNQSEMAELMLILEQRFAKMETRVETNESLIHLHDEMQRLKHQEARNSMSQDEHFVNQVNSRLNALEGRIKSLEEMMQGQRIEIDFKIDDFMRKVDKYLEKFVENTVQLAKKVESLQKEGDADVKHREDKVGTVDTKVDKLAEEIREKLKAICATMDDIGKLSETTATSLGDEKANFRKLEEDFFKLLATCKESNEHAEDYKWLSDEVSYLKFKQVQLMNFLNTGGNQSTSSYMNYQDP